MTSGNKLTQEERDVGSMFHVRSCERSEEVLQRSPPKPNPFRERALVGHGSGSPLVQGTQRSGKKNHMACMQGAPRWAGALQPGALGGSQCQVCATVSSHSGQDMSRFWLGLQHCYNSLLLQAPNLLLECLRAARLPVKLWHILCYLGRGRACERASVFVKGGQVQYHLIRLQASPHDKQLKVIRWGSWGGGGEAVSGCCPPVLSLGVQEGPWEQLFPICHLFFGINRREQMAVVAKRLEGHPYYWEACRWISVRWRNHTA